MNETQENARFPMFCSECDENVPVERLPDGTLLIQCPRCTGECAICRCHLVESCFAQGLQAKLVPSAEQAPRGDRS